MTICTTDPEGRANFKRSFGVKPEIRTPQKAMVAAILLSLLGAYLAVGLGFALLFVLFGVTRVDPHAVGGSWGFRLIIIPGVMCVWPLMLLRWFKTTSEPPEGLSEAHHSTRKEITP